MGDIKNYHKQGGDKWVVKGELEITSDGRLSFGGRELKPAKTQADSKARTIAELKDDFNLLLAKLKDAGLMKPD